MEGANADNHSLALRIQSGRAIRKILLAKSGEFGKTIEASNKNRQHNEVMNAQYHKDVKRPRKKLSSSNCIS